MSESVAKITKKWCLVKNNRRKIHFSNTILFNYDIFPTLQEVILALFQLFGDGFVGETGWQCSMQRLFYTSGIGTSGITVSSILTPVVPLMNIA